jgi:hypothetical protein
LSHGEALWSVSIGHVRAKIVPIPQIATGI